MQVKKKKRKERNVGQGGEQQDKMGRTGCGQKKGESLMCRIKKPKSISHLVDSIHSHLLPEQLSVLLRLKSWKLNFLNSLQLGSQMGIRAVPQQPLNVAPNAFLKNLTSGFKKQNPFQIFDTENQMFMKYLEGWRNKAWPELLRRFLEHHSPVATTSSSKRKAGTGRPSGIS